MWVERNGKTWRIRDEVAGRKVDVATGYPNKTLAKNALTQLKADALRGEALIPGGGKITVGQFLDQWWPAYARSLKPTAVKSEGGRVECHIRPMLGHLELDDLDALTV